MLLSLQKCLTLHFSDDTSFFLDARSSFSHCAPTATNLTELLSRNPNSNEELEVAMTLYRCEEEFFHELHRLIIMVGLSMQWYSCMFFLVELYVFSNIYLSQNTPGKISPMEKAKGVHCAVRLLHGDLTQVKLNIYIYICMYVCMYVSMYVSM